MAVAIIIVCFACYLWGKCAILKNHWRQPQCYEMMVGRQLEAGSFQLDMRILLEKNPQGSATLAPNQITFLIVFSSNYIPLEAPKPECAPSPITIAKASPPVPVPVPVPLTVPAPPAATIVVPAPPPMPVPGPVSVIPPALPPAAPQAAYLVVPPAAPPPQVTRTNMECEVEWEKRADPKKPLKTKGNCHCNCIEESKNAQISRE